MFDYKKPVNVVALINKHSLEFYMFFIIMRIILVVNNISMFIKTSIRTNKWVRSETHYLTESYRDKATNKVKHRYLVNISKLPKQSIIALKESLSWKSRTAKVNIEDLEVIASKQYGSIAVFWKIFDSIFKWIIASKYMKEIKAMVINRIFEPKSRKGLNNWIKQVDWLKLITNKNKLYKAIDYLEENQENIEKKLFKKRKEESCDLLLYDITSTYFEWEKVKIAKYGYSRDHRWDKLQVNIGLVTDSKWRPISVEVLEWNIVDKSTLQDQINKLRERFNIKNVTFIFDRWMKTKVNLEYIEEEWFDYITALNHAELKKKADENKWIQQSLFDKENLSEFVIEDKKYVLSYNPSKAYKDTYDRELLIGKTEEKLIEVQKFKRNYSLIKLQDKITKRINKYRCGKYINYSIKEYKKDWKVYGKLVFERNEEKIKYDTQFDWFYMVESTVIDIEWEELEKKYKSLQLVENTFDYIKNLIEIRPVYHWKDKRVKGHIFMCFMSYYLLYEFKEKFKELLEKNTLDTLLTELKSVNKVYLKIDKILIEKIENLNSIQKEIFKKFRINYNL